VTRRRNADAPMEPELPVTPMLDMAFQLLAFFVFTYNPSDLEGHLDLTLPPAGEARAKQEQDVDPNVSPDTELELPSEVTVVVKAKPDREGAGSRAATGAVPQEDSARPDEPE
jgi:biopolymer transport protein ExbD